ncbi:hypothetical protein ACSVDA_05495 [Cytobacillus sp. Hm23]
MKDENCIVCNCPIIIDSLGFESVDTLPGDGKLIYIGESLGFAGNASISEGMADVIFTSNGIDRTITLNEPGFDRGLFYFENVTQVRVVGDGTDDQTLSFFATLTGRCKTPFCNSCDCRVVISNPQVQEANMLSPGTTKQIYNNVSRGFTGTVELTGGNGAEIEFRFTENGIVQTIKLSNPIDPITLYSFNNVTFIEVECTGNVDCEYSISATLSENCKTF